MNTTNFQEFPIVKENMDLDLTCQVASANLLSKYDIMTYNKTHFNTDLFTNYFDLKSNYSNVYHYHVTVKASFSHKKFIATSAEKNFERNNEAKRKQVIVELLQFKQSEKFRYIYDGRKNLFTSIELPVSRSIFSIKLKTNEKYRIKIQQTKKYYGTNEVSVSLLQSMTWHSDFSGRKDLLQLNKALEKTYNSAIRFDRYYSVFSVDKMDIGKGLEIWRGYERTIKIDIGKGLEIWRGYERTIKITEAGPAYVLNVAELVFHRAGPVLDYTSDLLGFDVTKITRYLTADELNEIKNALRGLHVYIIYSPHRRKYIIEDISNKPATDVMMDIKDRVLSVAEYFEERYCRLLYPNLPCLKMETRKAYPIYIPLETCIVFEGQQKLDYHKADTEKAYNPVSNFESFSKYGQSDISKKLSLFTDLNRENTAYARDLLLSTCLEGSKFFYDTKKWSIQRKLSNLSNNSWIVVSFVDEIKLPLTEIAEFVDYLHFTCSTLRLWFGKFLGIRIIDQNEIIDNVFQKEEIKNATLAVILLPKDSFYNYAEIKFIAEYKLGLITKCILDNTIHILDRAIATRICLSIDSKIGGITCNLPQTPKIFSRPTIVFGAAIWKLPINSIPSVVGSLNAYPTKYQVSCRFQDEKNDIISNDYITDLGIMVKTILNVFYHNTEGKYPEKIIFFRYSDILSVLKLMVFKYHEIQAIEKTCEDVVGCTVPITFIVTTQHQSELFQSAYQNKSMTTSADNFHYILNGNVRDKPTHYYVIHDDNKFTNEELQQLTTHMCHVGNRGMPIPTPVKLAFSVAKHASKYVHHQCFIKHKVNIADVPDFVKDDINMKWNRMKVLHFSSYSMG